MTQAMTNTCPFSVGDTVRYQPTRRGHSLDVMSSERLTPGDQYKIEAIELGVYVTVLGYAHPGGGIYWSEFEAV